MKLLSFSFIALFLFMASPASSQTKKPHSSDVLKGYLVDKMCGSMMAKKSPEKAMEMGAKHTKMCATEEGCAASGYGILTDGKWIAFDETGNKKAAEYLNKTKAKDHLYIAVAGVREETKIKVSSIKEEKETIK